MSLHHPRLLKRGHVRDELTRILRAGRERIIALGGDCDSLSKMVESSMHTLDFRANEERYRL